MTPMAYKLKQYIHVMRVSILCNMLHSIISITSLGFCGFPYLKFLLTNGMPLSRPLFTQQSGHYGRREQEAWFSHSHRPPLDLSHGSDTKQIYMTQVAFSSSGQCHTRTTRIVLCLYVCLVCRASQRNCYGKTQALALFICFQLLLGLPTLKTVKTTRVSEGCIGQTPTPSLAYVYVSLNAGKQIFHCLLCISESFLSVKKILCHALHVIQCCH